MPVTNMLLVRFRVYTPNGAVKATLPHPLSWEAAMPFNDMSSLTLTYPDGTEASELLKVPCEIALEMRNPLTATYTEYPGCRFLNMRWSVDSNSRPGIISFTMPSYGWMLKKTRFLSPSNPWLNAERRVVLTGAHFPMEAVMVAIDEAHLRGNVVGLTYSFNQFVDSVGNSWGTGDPDRYMVDASFDYGQDAWSMLDAFSRQNYVDWIMDKRELKAYTYNTVLARNLALNTGVRIHSKLANAEDAYERTWEDQAGNILALGDNSSSYLYAAPSGLDYYPWGMWDDVISAGGISNATTLERMARKLASTKYKSRAQYTHRFAWTEGAPVPLAEYRQGDYVRAQSDTVNPLTGSNVTNMRIHQITLSGTDPYGTSIALTLNDRFLDRALQVERWVSRSNANGGPVGGAGTGGTGTGGTSFMARSFAVPALPEDTSALEEMQSKLADAEQRIAALEARLAGPDSTPSPEGEAE
jgi:hypothetical protein